ncbi:3850_t:CDS:2 [Dentiscutata heterogama]|uniref:3850_t:CDS:1 n=1 Tax=Dentiscutata heterogama TaxID=1316150 RepID=A0ACA9KKR2_9GLOM|nr:3850_t:CDS:2 [Dentiscutata heterogama]
MNQRLRQSSPESEPVPVFTSQSSSLMMLSQEEMDKLFGVNQF